MSETPLLGLPLLEAAQAQKHVTHNEALLLLDGVVHLAVASRALAAPPPSPADGERYLVASGASGDWAGHAGHIALREAGAWRFAMPRAGWRLWLADEALFVIFDGALWKDIGLTIGELQNVSRLGINASADATNRLAVKSPALLFDNMGAGVQAKLNKNAAADTASLLYQSNYSGRAELGLAGDNDFRLKVSADGAAWNDAMVVDRSTGAVSLPNTGIDGLMAHDAASFAAVGDGTTDNTAALAAAVAATADGEQMRLQPGSYVVAGPVSQTAKRLWWEGDYGAKFTLGSAANLFRDAVEPGDLSIVPVSGRVIAGGSNAAGNEAGQYWSMRIQSTGATASYQKNGHYITMITEDASAGTGNGGSGADINKDAVGLDSRGMIAANNPRGRVWGGFFGAQILAGGDGQANVVEGGLWNAGSNVPDPNGVFAKTGIKMVSMQGAASAAFQLAVNGGTGFYKGLAAGQATLVNHADTRFVELTDLFEVTRDGLVLIGKGGSAADSAGVEVDPIGQLRIGRAGSEPALQFNKVGTPGGPQSLANILYQGKAGDGSGPYNFVWEYATASDVTAGSLDSYWGVQTYVAGTLAPRAEIGAGIAVGSPSGGFKGDGTLNTAGAIYINGSLALEGKADSARLFRLLQASVNANDNTSVQPWFPSTGTLAVEANTTYRFKGRLYLLTGSTSHDINVSFGGSATLNWIRYMATEQTGGINTKSTTQTTLQINQASTTNVVAAVTGTRAWIEVEGVVSINAAGGFKPEFTFSAATGTQPQAEQGSYFEMFKIGAGAVTEYGTWS